MNSWKGNVQIQLHENVSLNLTPTDTDSENMETIELLMHIKSSNYRTFLH